MRLHLVKVHDFNAFFEMHFEYALKKCIGNILVASLLASKMRTNLVLGWITLICILKMHFEHVFKKTTGNMLITVKSKKV